MSSITTTPAGAQAPAGGAVRAGGERGSRLPWKRTKQAPDGPPISAKEKWGRRAMLAPALVFTIVVTQLPFLFTLGYSLQDWNLFTGKEASFTGLSNYSSFFTDALFRDAIWHSVLLTGSSVIGSLVLGTFFALLLDRKFLGRGLMRTLLISPFLIMPAAASLLWKNPMFDPTFGILNFVLGPFGAGETDWISQYPALSIIIVEVWQWTPFMMLIVLAGLQGQDRDVQSAAAIDGASLWRTFTRITLPVLRPFMELGTVLGTIFLLNIYDPIFLITSGGPGTATTNVPYFLYQKSFKEGAIGEAAALAVVAVVATIIIATLALRVLSDLFSEEGMEGR